MIGTHFTIFDNGKNPEERSVQSKELRRELAAVAYVSVQN